MLHFFPTFSKQAEASPFGQAVRDLGVEHRFFPGAVDLVYRSRTQLILQCLPRLAWFALRSAVRSLCLSRPLPRAVLVGSDIEVLVFGTLRRLLCRRTRIVLTSFIYTRRRAKWQNGLRLVLFRFVLGFADLVIVHSRLEAETYPGLLQLPAVRFAFVPWGTNIHIRERLLRDPLPFRTPPAVPYILSAGKSGRDYPTLLHAMQDIATDLRIICDFPPALHGAPLPGNVTVLDDCHGDEYILEMYWADIVVVPLAVDDISAGQMVVVQAMALGKAIIVTHTPTISDYVTDREDALLVERGDVAGLRSAIQLLLVDPALRARLGRNAMARFERNHTTERHIRSVIEEVQTLV